MEAVQAPEDLRQKDPRRDVHKHMLLRKNRRHADQYSEKQREELDEKRNAPFIR